MSNTTPPVIRHTDAAAQWATSEERTPLFTIVTPSTVEGEPDVEHVYTMPAKPNPGLALQFLRRAREEGELAMSWIIETAVGRDGYIALENDLVSFDGDPTALLRDLVAKIQRVAMGGLDGGPKA